MHAPQKKTSGAEIEELIALLAKLPGLGPRSARRAALHLIKKREQLLLPLARALSDAAGKIAICKECGNIDTQQPCAVCSDGTRDPSLICVVEEVADLWALERARIVRYRYHVLGGTLSPLDGRGPDDLSIAKLIERAHTLADHIMTQPRTTRRLTTQIVRRPWRQRITNDLDGGFGIQMFAHLAKKAAVHGRQHIGDTVAYVRKGKKNNFDK